MDGVFSTNHKALDPIPSSLPRQEYVAIRVVLTRSRRRSGSWWGRRSRRCAALTTSCLRWTSPRGTETVWASLYLKDNTTQDRQYSSTSTTWTNNKHTSSFVAQFSPNKTRIHTVVWRKNATQNANNSLIWLVHKASLLKSHWSTFNLATAKFGTFSFCKF